MSATTSATSRWRTSRIWRELRPFVSLVPGLVAYGILRVVFAHVMGSHGLVTPSGSPSKALAVFGLIMLVMRIAVLVIVPLVVTYRVVRRLFELGNDRSHDRARRNRQDGP